MRPYFSIYYNMPYGLKLDFSSPIKDFNCGYNKVLFPKQTSFYETHYYSLPKTNVYNIPFLNYPGDSQRHAKQKRK